MRGYRTTTYFNLDGERPRRCDWPEQDGFGGVPRSGAASMPVTTHRGFPAKASSRPSARPDPHHRRHLRPRTHPLATPSDRGHGRCTPAYRRRLAARPRRPAPGRPSLTQLHLCAPSLPPGRRGAPQFLGGTARRRVHQPRVHPAPLPLRCGAPEQATACPHHLPQGRRGSRSSTAGTVRRVSCQDARGQPPPDH